MTGFRDTGYRIDLQFNNHVTTASYSQLAVEILAFIAIIVYAVLPKLRRRQFPELPELSEEEKDRIIAEWEPHPLVPETPEDHPVLQTRCFDSKVSKHVILDGVKYMNYASTNFLGFVGDPRIEEVAKEAVSKYGVGSCGPRSFYGTVDLHLDLEKQIAEFLGCEETVLYSYGFPTAATAIPSYAKKNDVIFVDKGVNFAIQKGLEASRSRIEWFEHNNVEHLEQLLLKQAEKDRKNPGLAARTRRFMIVEGLYESTGDLCPLPAIMALKWKYKVRLFIDESFSIGVIGKTGRGVTEHFGIDVADVDLIIGSLENALCSTGGFCAGRTFVVNHQRLSSWGYCFSASLPPLLAAAAYKSLEIIEEDGERLAHLRQNCKHMNEGLKRAFLGTSFFVESDELSPVQVVYSSSEDADARLDRLVKQMRERFYLLARAQYLLNAEAFQPEPSIRVMVQSEMTEEELYDFLKVLREGALEADQ